MTEKKVNLMTLAEIEQIEKDLGVSLCSPSNAFGKRGERYTVYTLDGFFLGEIVADDFFSDEELRQKILAIIRL